MLERRSYLAGRMGQQAFHPDFTLVDDGGDPLGLPKAFDFEGTPKLPVTIVETGVVRDVVWDRRSAAGGGQRQGLDRARPAGAGPASAPLP